jgi:Tol biopolymer transport system component
VGASCCPAWSPDGSRIAFVESDIDGYALFVMDVSSRSARRVLHLANVDALRWPRRDLLAFLSYRNLYTLRPDGKARKLLLRLKKPEFGAFDVSPDGRRIVFEDEGHLWMIRADGTGRRAITPKRPHYSEYDPVWSPDGKAVAFIVQDCSGTERCNTGGLWTLRLRDGRRRQVSAEPGSSDFTRIDWQPVP